jgi:adrenodoxin-NADP+ reductase
MSFQHCQDKFEEVASSPKFNFIGNIDIGKDLPLASLSEHYNAILFAYGATKDRKLGIPGEDDLRGIYSARDFVGWYNGLPAHAGLAPDLESGEEAIIVGQGNVALDVARTLLTDVSALRKTDMTDYALATLSKSRVKRVRVVGRRGPMQVMRHLSFRSHQNCSLTFSSGCFYDKGNSRAAESAIRFIRPDRRCSVSTKRH